MERAIKPVPGHPEQHGDSYIEVEAREAGLCFLCERYGSGFEIARLYRGQVLATRYYCAACFDSLTERLKKQ